MAESINLFVANLDRRIGDAELQHTFAKYGDIVRAVVAKDEMRNSIGYGFVHFKSMSDGVKALEEASGMILYNRTINVQIARQQYEGSYVTPQQNGITTWNSEWTMNSSHESETFDSASQMSDDQKDDQNTAGDGIKQRMCKLFEKQLYTDVLFYQKNNPDTSLSAHRAVLAVGSPLFTQMLFGNQNSDTSGMLKIQINNMSFKAFSSIVKFLYTDDISFESEELVQKILNGAKEFQIPSLLDCCKSYFEMQEITEENVCSRLHMAITDNIEILKKRCIEYIQKNTHEVFRSPDFQKCSLDTMHVICKLQPLNLRSEVKLLEAAMSWLNCQPAVKRRVQSESLLKCIRFLTFSVTEFSNIIKQYPDILTSNDALLLMMYLNNPSSNISDSMTLPVWCNKNPTSRCFLEKNPQFGNIPPDNGLDGKIIFPLTESLNAQSVIELTSTIQMNCIMGFHELHSIKFAFQGPITYRSVIKMLTINIRVLPSKFNTQEIIKIANSVDVKVTFRKIIKVRQGDVVYINASVKYAQGYTFLKFDEACRVKPNPHFQCSIASKPKVGKLFFINEIEYSPQKREFDNLVLKRKNFN